MERPRTSKELLKWTLEALRSRGLRPRKRLSQSFVVDMRLIEEVLAKVERGDIVAEIGCGLGNLTMYLLDKAGRVVCVEIDERMLRALSSSLNKAIVLAVNGDARDSIPLCDTVVSNVPYHIVSDIIVAISRENAVKKAVLTVQKEVAERLAAKPGGRSYGRLTALVNALFDIELGGVYPPSSFYPRPKVYSQVVVLRRKRAYDERICKLEQLTRILFNQRRRVAYRVLQRGMGLSEEELSAAKGVVGDLRVYELDADRLLKLVEVLWHKLPC